jgi:uncharacterized damage-inducible protein DinB
MITPAYAYLMARYNAEMNRRVYSAAEGLTEAQRRAECGAFFGSVHATLNHLVWADRMWMSRFDGWEKPAVGVAGSVGLYDDFAELWTARQALDVRLLEWAGRIDQAFLDGALRWYSGAMGREMTMQVAPLVAHLFNHQTHHRGQVHAMLTRFGARTGDTDLPFIL